MKKTLMALVGILLGAGMVYAGSSGVSNPVRKDSQPGFGSLSLQSKIVEFNDDVVTELDSDEDRLDAIEGGTVSLADLDVDGSVNVNLLNSSDEITITQTGGVGTASTPLLGIDDNRTGTTANAANEAAIWIDSEGSYGIAVVDGIVQVEGTIDTPSGSMTLDPADQQVNIDGGLNVGGTADPGDNAVIIDGLTASKMVFTDGDKRLSSTGTAGIDQGGTGDGGPWTTNGVFYGNGDAAFGVTDAGTDNQALMGATGAAPSFRSLTDADVPDSITVTNYRTIAEADAAYATAAQGVSATNAETKVTSGADPGHTHTAYATAAQGVAATNAQTLAQARIASVAMSMAHNDATNGVVYMQLKNAAGSNPGAQYMATIWVSKTPLGAPDASDLDVASSITTGTTINELVASDMYYTATDGDGKISWAFVTTVTPNTNYFYCSVDGVVLGSQTVVIPME